MHLSDDELRSTVRIVNKALTDFGSEVHKICQNLQNLYNVPAPKK